MSGAGRQGIAPVGWSIALHALIAGLLYLGLSMPLREPDPQPMPLPIDAVVVDEAVIQAAGNQRRDVERRQAEERRLELAAQEAAERERLEAEQRAREAERQTAEAEQRRQAEAAAERKARAEADAKRQAEADAKRRAEQQAAAERKRAAEEARLREQREQDLKALLAAEDQRTGPAFQSLTASYVRAIQAHVEQRWYEPPGMPSGMSCTVFVTQIPGGDVVGTRFGACNGGAAVRQSIETAVRNASPLPAPPEPALFAREVKLVFTPKETRR